MGCERGGVLARGRSQGCIPCVILADNAAEISLVERALALGIHSKRNKALAPRGLPCAVFVSLRRVSPANEVVLSATKLRQCDVLDPSRVSLTRCFSSLLKRRSRVYEDVSRSRLRWSLCGRGGETFGFTSRRGDYWRVEILVPYLSCE